MRKMFFRGGLSVAVCIGVGTGSLKADFEADLLSVLSVDARGFSEEIGWDPVYWGRLYDLYKAHKDLYGNFCKDIRDLVKGSEFATKTVLSAEENPDAFAERAFCLLKFSRDVYGKVSEYMSSAWDLDEEDAFKDIDALLLSECRYAFVRRLLGLSKFIIRHCANKFDLSAFDGTKDRKPNGEILAKILKPFAKGDAYKELRSNDNNLQLIQSLRVLSNVFNRFSLKSSNMLAEMQEVFEEPLSSWFNVPTTGREVEYYEYVFEQQKTLIVALRDLSQNVSERIERMLSVKGKLLPEEKKEALGYFKKEKDIGALLDNLVNFRIKEKGAREKEQEAFAKAKTEREKLEREIAAKKKALKAKKEELYKLQESGTEISDKKKELENEIQELNKTIERLKEQINELSYPSIKSKHKMQRGAAKKGIPKGEHDMAVFANYVQLPDKCRAFQNAFLYYQTIMWNIFTNSVDVIKKCRQKSLKIKEPELTDEKEPELTDEKEPELTDEKEPELTDEEEPELTDDFEDDYYGLGEDI